jgi:hypothetical protein
MNGSDLANRDLRQQLLAEDERQHIELEEDRELHRQYLRARERALRNASNQGLPNSEFWIKPEDIIF